MAKKTPTTEASQLVIKAPTISELKIETTILIEKTQRIVISQEQVTKMILYSLEKAGQLPKGNADVEYELDFEKVTVTVKTVEEQTGRVINGKIEPALADTPKSESPAPVSQPPASMTFTDMSKAKPTEPSALDGDDAGKVSKERPGNP